jgi:predicted nucleotidyltransferase
MRTESSIERKEIRQMVGRIVSRFHPERIILFGSHARGDAGPNSDVDLLVVMPVQGSKREKAVEIGAALHDIRLPKDIIVTTPEVSNRVKRSRARSSARKPGRDESCMPASERAV